LEKNYRCKNTTSIFKNISFNLQKGEILSLSLKSGEKFSKKFPFDIYDIKRGRLAKRFLKVGGIFSGKNFVAPNIFPPLLDENL
jgi:hypothetical protein